MKVQNISSNTQSFSAYASIIDEGKLLTEKHTAEIVKEISKLGTPDDIVQLKFFRQTLQPLFVRKTFDIDVMTAINKTLSHKHYIGHEGEISSYEEDLYFLQYNTRKRLGHSYVGDSPTPPVSTTPFDLAKNIISKLFKDNK